MRASIWLLFGCLLSGSLMAQSTTTTTTTTTNPDGSTTTTVEETTTESSSGGDDVSTAQPKLVGPTGVTGTIRRADRRQDRRGDELQRPGE